MKIRRSTKDPGAKDPGTEDAKARGGERAAGEGFVVQVAAVKERSEADTIAKRLQSKGFPSFVSSPSAGAARVYRVRVGKYRRSQRSRNRRSPARKRRTVQALDYPLALIAGVLLALGFPKFGHPAFAWIALVPLLVALTGWRGRPERISRGSPRCARSRSD